MELQIKEINNGLLYYTEDGNEKTKPVSDKVNPKFIREGLAEVSETEGVVTFIKMIKKEVQTPEIKPANQTNSQYRRPIEIIRQECLAESVRIITLTGEKDDVFNKVKNLANDLVGWVTQ